MKNLFVMTLAWVAMTATASAAPKATKDTNLGLNCRAEAIEVAQLTIDRIAKKEGRSNGSVAEVASHDGTFIETYDGQSSKHEEQQVIFSVEGEVYGGHYTIEVTLSAAGKIEQLNSCAIRNIKVIPRHDLQ